MKKLTNTLWLGVIAAPAFAIIAYQYEPDNRVEVYGSEYASPKSVAIPKKLKSEDVCLAENIYFEARSESYKGKTAIVNTTLKRVNDHWYPSSICKVVYQPNQFSWTLKKELTIEEPNEYQKAELIAQKALAKQLPQVVGSADHYYAISIPEPSWAKNMKFIGRIGNHLFFDSKQPRDKNDKRPKTPIKTTKT